MAERMPIGMARRSESTNALPRTTRVAGKRWRMRVRTEERDWKEVPHWPVAIDLAHLAYWTGRGSERPSCLRIFSLTASGTLGSAANWAKGSPGAREMMAKRTMEMAIKVGTAVTNRRMMYLPMRSHSSRVPATRYHHCILRESATCCQAVYEIIAPIL